MDLKEINRAIVRGTWTNDDLNSMIESIKYARGFLVNEKRRAIRVGDSIRFNSTKLGGPVTGTVESVKIKFATVNTSRGRWRVAISRLEAA